MKMKRINFQSIKGAAIIVLLLISNCPFAQNSPGKTHAEKIKIDGIERSYFIHLPDKLPAKAPLVFVLHGYGGTASPDSYGMKEVSDKNGFAVCFPQAEKDLRGKASWNVNYGFQAGRKLDDVSFLTKLSKHLQKKYNLSSKNVFCTGMSAGGDMGYLLAYRKPEAFAAISSVAGFTMEWIYNTLEAPAPVPFFEIHGTKDCTTYWDGDLEDKGGWGSYISIPLAVGYWVAKNRCTGLVVDTLAVKNRENGHYVVSHKYINGIHGNEVWLYEIVNGEHTWGDEDLNTSEEIWKFFSKFIK